MMESISRKRFAAVQRRSSSIGRGAALLFVSACVSHCSLGDFDSLSADLAADQLHNGDLPAGAAGASSDAGSGPNTGGGGAGGDGSSGQANGGDGGSTPPDAGGTVEEPEAGAPQNLFADPGFEEGAPRWTPVGTCTLALSTVNPRSGINCLSSSDRSETWEGPGYDLIGLLEPSTSYTATVWVRAPEGSFVVNWTFKNRCVEVTGDPTYTQLPSVRATTDWTELTVTFTTPPCALIDSMLYVEGPAIGTEFFIDDTSLFRTSP